MALTVAVAASATLSSTSGLFQHIRVRMRPMSQRRRQQDDEGTESS
jgi:hypothetical protein